MSSIHSPGRARTYNPSVNSRMLCHWATEEYGIRQWPILPGRLQPSTFGTEGLNFCVRDGNRWNPFVITTGNLCCIWQQVLLYSGASESQSSFRNKLRFLLISYWAGQQGSGWLSRWNILSLFYAETPLCSLSKFPKIIITCVVWVTFSSYWGRSGAYRSSSLFKW